VSGLLGLSMLFFGGRLCSAVGNVIVDPVASYEIPALVFPLGIIRV
jgi:hypothetical protein